LEVRKAEDLNKEFINAFQPITKPGCNMIQRFYNDQQKAKLGYPELET
jgi:hypothetical protein